MTRTARTWPVPRAQGITTYGELVQVKTGTMRKKKQRRTIRSEAGEFADQHSYTNHKAAKGDQKRSR